MLDKAIVEPTAQGERYKVTFDLDGRKACVELRDLARGSLKSGFVRDQFDREPAAMSAPPGQQPLPHQPAPAGWRLGAVKK